MDPFDPSSMTPEARTREVASLLARGYLRQRARGGLDTARQPENSLAQPGDQAPLCAPGERPLAGGPAGAGNPERRRA